MFGFFYWQRRLLTQRSLLYCHHCSNPGLPIDCHDWLLPLHTIAITHCHCLGSFIFGTSKKSNKSKSNPGLPRSVAPITDHCPESFTSSPTHGSAQHSFMGTIQQTIWKTIKKCSCFAPKVTDYKFGQKQVSKIWGQIG